MNDPGISKKESDRSQGDENGSNREILGQHDRNASDECEEDESPAVDEASLVKAVNEGNRILHA